MKDIGGTSGGGLPVDGLTALVAPDDEVVAGRWVFHPNELKATWMRMTLD